MNNNYMHQGRYFDELYSSEHATKIYDQQSEGTFFNIANERFFYSKLSDGCLNNKIILDLGAGGGNIGKGIRNRSCRIVNFDISHKALLHAQERIKNIKAYYIQGNMYALPFREKSIDVIVCHGVLHHLDNLPMAVKEIRRVLKDSGFFLGFEPNARYPWISFWLELLYVPGIFKSLLIAIYERLQKKNSQQGICLTTDYTAHNKSGKHFFKEPAEYSGVFRRCGFPLTKISTVIIEFFPPRLLFVKSKILVGWLISLSGWIDKSNLAHKRVRYMTIEAKK